jgi:hypothetical protein
LPYWFSASDTDKNLELLVRFKRDPSSRHFSLQHQGGVDLLPDQLIAALPAFDIDLTEFLSQDGSVSIPLPVSATLEVAATRLAQHFYIARKHVVLLVPARPDENIWNLRSPITCVITRQRVNFVLDEDCFTLDVDPDNTIQDLQLVLDREQQLGRVTLWADGSELDPEMTLGDLEGIPFFEVRITGQLLPADYPSYEITVVLGIIPRLTRIRCPPTATLAEAEEEVRKKVLELEGIPVDFFLCDTEAETAQQPIGKDPIIGEIELKSYPGMAAAGGASRGYGARPGRRGRHERGCRGACPRRNARHMWVDQGKHINSGQDTVSHRRTRSSRRRSWQGRPSSTQR